MITETDDIQRALDAAAIAMPELAADRAALLRRLVGIGAESMAASGAEDLARRVVAIRQTAGSVDHVYRADEADLLRAEWPA